MPFSSQKRKAAPAADVLRSREAAAATSLAQAGYYSRAAKALARAEQPPNALDNTEHVLAEMHRLHPQAPLPPPSPDMGHTQHFSIDAEKFLLVLSRARAGKSPGPSGWTEELLFAVCANPVAASSLLSMSLDMMNGSVGPVTGNFLRACRLVAIGKPDGTLRPIAVGECLVRIVSSLALAAVLDHLLVIFGDLQLAMCPGGAEAIVHEVRAALEGGATVVAMDFRNAFNTLSRRWLTGLVRPDPLLAPIRPLFDLLYSFASPLFLGLGKEVAVLASTEGTRQGCVFGTALFCLGIHPVLRVAAARWPLAKVRAFCDDITVFGDRAQCEEAAAFIRKEFDIIGLALAEKTKVFGPGAVEIAASLGATVATDGIKILGCMVALNDELVLAFLRARLEKSSLFFSRLEQLSPDVARALLAFCGHPRWNFLSRTHTGRPAITTTKAFDDLIIAALCRIAKTDVDDLTPTNLMFMHLPTSEGGAGLRLHQLLREGNYEASVNPDSDDQQTRTEAIDRQLSNVLDAETSTRARRMANKKYGASVWLNALPVGVVNPDQYAESLRYRLGVLPSFGAKTRIRCDCGHILTPETFASHVLGCTKIPGVGPSTRHAAVETVSSSFSRQRGAHAQSNPPLEGTDGYADTAFFLPEAVHVVDYVISSTLAESQPSNEKAERRKRVRYAGHTVPLVVAAMEVCGGLSKATKQLIADISRAVDEDPAVLTAEISRTIQQMNGAILLKARRRFLLPRAEVAAARADADAKKHASARPAPSAPSLPSEATQSFACSPPVFSRPTTTPATRESPFQDVPGPESAPPSPRGPPSVASIDIDDFLSSLDGEHDSAASVEHHNNTQFVAPDVVAAEGDDVLLDGVRDGSCGSASEGERESEKE